MCGCAVLARARAMHPAIVELLRTSDLAADLGKFTPEPVIIAQVGGSVFAAGASRRGRSSLRRWALSFA